LDCPAELDKGFLADWGEQAEKLRELWNKGWFFLDAEEVQENEARTC